MKRKADTIDDTAASAIKKAPRQDPVSCQTCRKRKLKCDRETPCGSCSARKLECIYSSSRNSVVPPSPVSRKTKATEVQYLDTPAPTDVSNRPCSTNPGSPRPSTEPPGHNSNVLPEPYVSSSTLNSDCLTTNAQPCDESVATVERLETIVMGHWIPNAVPVVLRAGPASFSQPRFLSEDHSSTKDLHASLIGKNRSILDENPSHVHLPSYLPPWAEAMCMLQYYFNNLDFQYHVMIPSRTERQIQGIYDAVNRQECIDLGHTALLFSIVASTVYYKLQSGPLEYAVSCSQAAAFLAGAALMQSDYIAYPTLEGLQASMVIGHYLSNTSLPSSVSSMFVHRLFINQAINMKLHLIDCPRSANEHGPESHEKVTIELKRRMWWDLVSYDWLLSYLSGPQQWTYSVSPHQMNVNLPLNIEDSEIGKTDTGAPISTPTIMTYSLYRLNLAIISREIADSYAHHVLHGQELPYEKILELDRKLRDSMNALPEFFRFGQKAQREYAALYRERPALAWQRSMLVLGYHFRFCRLHRRYFVRGAKEPKYSYSHVICLQSARTVLEIKRTMDEEQPVLTPSSSLIWSVMHHVFMAAVILLVDLCFNWEDVLAEKRKEEVLAACRLLTRARQSSDVAHRAVDAMMEILQKHWKQNKGAGHVAADLRSSTQTGVRNPEDTTSKPPHHAVDDPKSITHVLNFGVAQPAPFDAPLEDLWTDMLDGTANSSFGTPDWTDLLTELTNAPFPVE
ncbi:hypothetical protein Q7P37_000548 [Cladosporium fusiforme]